MLRDRVPQSRTVAEMSKLVRSGDLRAVSRAISAVEDGSPEARELLATFGPVPDETRVIGISGSPGAGKSTLTRALVSAYRMAGLRVGVVAVDPSSPFTGGAFLGDRIRMQDHAMDDEVFIRSMANHGNLGGLAASVPQVVRVLAAAGCDRILIETVGVGQAEVGVDAVADSTVVLLTPNSGDAIQGGKAGILEVADIIVVNKADREGASDTVRDLRYALSATKRAQDDWTAPILMTTASRGEGVGELVEELDRHFAWAAASGHLADKRRRRVAVEIENLVLDAARARFQTASGSAALERAVDQVLSGEADLHDAAAGPMNAILGPAGWGLDA